jgi:hypothetical protein
VPSATQNELELWSLRQGKIEKVIKRRVLLAGGGTAFILSASLVLAVSGMRFEAWFGNLALAFSMPGFLAAGIIGPFAGLSVHSDHPRMFWALVFVLNVFILWTALLIVVNLIERLMNRKKREA